MLDRPRHEEIIATLRSVGARVHLISDGDVAGVINCTKPETGIDLYIGQGGAPEGVLAAAALKCVGGQFQGRLVFRNDDESVARRTHRRHRFQAKICAERTRLAGRDLYRYRRDARLAAGRRADRQWPGAYRTLW